jgi:acetoin utilization deacetylase AcuC-like enzyme
MPDPLPGAKTGTRATWHEDPPSGPRHDPAVLRVYAHDRFTFPVPDNHRFPLGKYALVRALIAANPDVSVEEGPPASWEDVARVHHPEWVRRVRYGLLDRREQAGLGLPWSPALVTRALHSCGSTTAAARAALTDGVGAALGGGMHHAGYRLGRGYCTFNDVAIAIEALRTEGRVERALILDLDVHQGDGNAELYADDRDTVVVSLHGARNYPFTRPPSDLDIDLRDGTGDEGYLEALDEAVAFALAHGPYELAVLIAGADPFAGDALGRLALTPEGLAERDRRAIGALRTARIPVCVTLAGGYGRPLEATAAIHAATIAAAAARASA